MYRVDDVVAYILKKQGPISCLKLQKLLYYCQAWSLVWEDRPLFRERILADRSGPIVPEFYRKHRGLFQLKVWNEGDRSKLAPADRETVEAVLEAYGHKNAQYLSDLTRQEDPYRDTPEGEEITHEKLMEYYAALPPSEKMPMAEATCEPAETPAAQVTAQVHEWVQSPEGQAAIAAADENTKRIMRDVDAAQRKAADEWERIKHLPIQPPVRQWWDR